MSSLQSNSRLPSSIRLRRTVIAVHLAFGVLMAIAGQTPALAQQNIRSVIAYDIPAGTMSDALSRFAQQSGVALSIEANRLAGLQSPGLRGSYAIEEGFNTLLRGSGYVIGKTAAGYMLVRAPAGSPGSAAADATETTLPVVTVTDKADTESAFGPAKGYVAHRSASATKTDTALIKTPQAVSVVTRQQLDDQNVQSVAQALRYTSGINPEQRGTNTDSLEYLYGRGFLVDEFWNGLRTPGPAGGFGYNVTSFDPYMLERVELLHGPGSVLYGQGSPGGVVNLVSKRPTATPLHEIGIQTGSYGRKQAFFDFSGPLDQDGKLLYRLTGDGISTGTQTDYVNEKRIAIAPTLTWRPDADTSLTLFANYQSDPDAGYYNSVPIGGAVAAPRSFYPGEPGFDSFQKMQKSVGYEFEHAFNDTVSFKQSYRYLNNNQTIKYVAAEGGFTPDGMSMLRTAYSNNGSVISHTIDNQLTAKFQTGAATHTATAGIDFQHIQFDHTFLGLDTGTVAPISIANPQYGATVPPLDFMFGTSNAFTVRQLGAYLQDQFDIGNWSFLTGIREDWANEDTVSFKTGARASQSESATTWRLGTVYKFDNGVAPYTSYSRSFTPQVGSDFSGNSFSPSKGEQYEAGVKFQPNGTDAFVTASVFQLTQQNVPTPDPAHSGFQVLTGAVRSRGLELEAHANMTKNLKLIGSYTYNNLVNTQSNATNLGKAPVGIPRHTASLWADYKMASGLQVGGGVRFMGSTNGDTLNTFTTASATLLDLSIRYDLGRAFQGMKGWTASLNASNLLDRQYLASCNDTTSCYWGQARLVLAGLKYQW